MKNPSHFETILRVIMIFAFILTASCGSSSKTPNRSSYSRDTADRTGLLNYSELQILDYDEMLIRVRDHITKAHSKIAGGEFDPEIEEGDPMQDREAVEELRNALKLVLSRPNTDNMVAKLIPEVRKELMNFNAYEDTLSSVTGEALDLFQRGKLPTVYLSTQLFVIENVMSEIQPDARRKAEYREILVKIRDANIKIPSIVTQDRQLRGMHQTSDPSKRAAHVLDLISKSSTQP